MTGPTDAQVAEIVAGMSPFDKGAVICRPAHWTLGDRLAMALHGLSDDAETLSDFGLRVRAALLSQDPTHD